MLVLDQTLAHDGLHTQSDGYTGGLRSGHTSTCNTSTGTAGNLHLRVTLKDIRRAHSKCCLVTCVSSAVIRAHAHSSQLLHHDQL